MRVPFVVLCLGIVLLAGCSKKAPGDADGDGLSDAEEQAGWLVTVETLDHYEERHVVSDRTESDTDEDGLPDRYEFALGGDPTMADTDGDGLTDCEEAFTTRLADCEDPDFSGEGDGGYGTRINDVDSDLGPGRYVSARPYVGPAGSSVPPPLSGDGILDGDEVRGYQIVGLSRTITVQTDPLHKDSDRDGAEDGEERFLYRSDPENPDSDGDGCRDGLDPIPERIERFGLGLQSFTWKRDADAHVRLTGILADAFVVPPGGLAGFLVPAGGQVGGPDLETRPVRPGGCSYAPHDPWVQVNILAEEVRDGLVAPLDIHSGTNPGGQVFVWWNVRDQRLRMDRGGADLAVPIRWEGADGVLVFQPALETPVS